MTTTVQQLNDAIQNNSNPGDWRSAVDAVTQVLTDMNEVMSSGQIARFLRHNQPDLRFAVPSIGEHLRDGFYGGMLQYSDPISGTIPAVQVPRTTQGLGRTGAGQMVFCYAANDQDALNAAFEVDIPVGGSPVTPDDPNALWVDLSLDSGQVVNPATQPGATATAAKPANGGPATKATQSSAVVLAGAKAAVDKLRASVKNDGRMYIPRGALEAAIYAGGQPMRGGDPVYVKVTASTVTVSQAKSGDDGERKFTLTRTRGRVELTSPDASAPFTPGKTYAMAVEPGVVIVDITKPLN